MADVKLDPTEMTIWNERGSRGDIFRRGMLDRVAEQARLEQQMMELLDGTNGDVLATQGSGEPDPEGAAPADARARR